MRKTADEMFTVLGYYRYDYLDHVDYYNEKIRKIISFRKNGTFACFNYDDEYMEITMQELQAINKKCKELGVDKVKILKDKIKVSVRECKDVEIKCPNCEEKNIFYDVDLRRNEQQRMLELWRNVRILC